MSDDLLRDADLAKPIDQAKRNADLFACALSGQISGPQWEHHLRTEPGLRRFVLSEYERVDAIARRRRQN